VGYDQVNGAAGWRLFKLVVSIRELKLLDETSQCGASDDAWFWHPTLSIK